MQDYLIENHFWIEVVMLRYFGEDSPTYKLFQKVTNHSSTWNRLSLENKKHSLELWAKFAERNGTVILDERLLRDHICGLVKPNEVISINRLIEKSGFKGNKKEFLKILERIRDEDKRLQYEIQKDKIKILETKELQQWV